MTRNQRREAQSRLFGGLVYGMAILALIPLSLVLGFTILKGLPAISHSEFFLNVERPIGIPGGGISHAITGTLIMVGMASLLAIPVGIMGGLYLVEYGHGRWANYVRLASDVLTGAPSIALGLFAYAIIVKPSHHFSAYSAALALSVLMLPVVIRTTESAVGLIPGGLREAGLALGLARWKVALLLILPAAAPGVITGALLAVARAAGETAPLLFTSLGNKFYSVDPNGPMSSLTLIVFNGAQSPYPEINGQAWGAALVLVLIVLLINLASRFALRRQIALAGKL